MAASNHKPAAPGHPRHAGQQTAGGGGGGGRWGRAQTLGIGQLRVCPLAPFLSILFIPPPPHCFFVLPSFCHLHSLSHHTPQFPSRQLLLEQPRSTPPGKGGEPQPLQRGSTEAPFAVHQALADIALIGLSKSDKARQKSFAGSRRRGGLYRGASLMLSCDASFRLLPVLCGGYLTRPCPPLLLQVRL